MKNKYLLKIADISGWIVLLMLIFYFISGYALVHKYGMSYLMNHSLAWFWHSILTVPFLIFLFLHIIPYYIVRKQIKKLIAIISLLVLLPVISLFVINKFQKYEIKTHLKSEQNWYYPAWAVNAKYDQSIKVLDTESALGRYAKQTKTISLKNMALIHGHLCDGLVISFIQIKAVLEKLFPDGVIDRTDLRVVSKNGPCWVDTASMMTGARINFGTLSIQPETGDGFIIQKISTGETYSVHLKPGVFPTEQAELEKKIRTLAKQGKEVSPQDIDKVEKMQDELSKKLLNTEPQKILDIKHISGYTFKFKSEIGKRGDVINKNVNISTN